MNEVDHLPHRPPFRFVDRVVGRGPETLTTVKVAGVGLSAALVLECLAQSAGLLARDARAGALAAVRRFRMRRRVEPGDVLEIRVRIIRRLGRLLTARGEVQVKGRTIAKGEVTLALS